MSPTLPMNSTGGDRLTPVAARFLARANSECAAGLLPAAKRTLDSVLALAPASTEALRLMAAVCQHLDDHATAAWYFRKLSDLQPTDPLPRLGLGVSLAAIKDVDGAVVAFRSACEVSPGSADAWHNLGEALERANRSDEAIEAFERVRSINPAHVAARLSIARVWASVGDVEKAAQEYRALTQNDSVRIEAWFGLSYLGEQWFEPDDLPCLTGLLAREGLTPDAREQLRFALAKALEHQKRYEEAFAQFKAANELGCKRVQWNATAAHERVRAVIQAFARTEDPIPSDSRGSEAVFVVSMPRSGSTLVEQMLASHSTVDGTSETEIVTDLLKEESVRQQTLFPLWVNQCNSDVWAQLGKQYLERIRLWRGTKPMFIDKSLSNWMFVGAILRMLPGSHIVVVRRDPVETCLGCYRQYFSPRYGFASNLESCAQHYIDFYDATRQWLSIYPTHVMEIEYESLTNEPEVNLRKLFQFCELQYEPACLNFHQLRRAIRSLPSASAVSTPLRRDTSRAQLYGHNLDQLRGWLASMYHNPPKESGRRSAPLY